MKKVTVNDQKDGKVTGYTKNTEQRNWTQWHSHCPPQGGM